MADVWLARTRARGTFVRLLALKVLRPDALTDPHARERFLREAEIAASIHHANVVDVTDIGEESGVLYQAMTLVEGESLAGLLRGIDERLPLGVTLSIIVDALRGLSAAHESVDASGTPRSVVHRDVSPQNILVGRDGLARISDFGIARVLSDDDESTGSMPGKYAYFAPEQVAREPVDARTDVFAMGIVAWEALTWVRLFKSGNVVETLDAVCHLAVPDPRTHVPDLPEGVVLAVMKALERGPADRHASAAAMADALVAAADASGVLLARAAVGEIVEAVAGDRLRSLAKHAAASPSPPDPSDEATLLDPGARPTSRWPLAIAAFVLVASFLALALTRTPPSDGRAAVAEGPRGLPELREAAPAVSVDPASMPSQAPLPVASTRAIIPAGHVRSHASGAPPARKPPFQDNPFKAR